MAGATNYPGSLDDFAEASPTNLGDNDTTGRTHTERHDDIEAAMEAVQGTLGVDPAGTAASLVARFENLEAGNSISIGTVTTVATGGTATASITGTYPTQTLNLGLVTGATGAIGSFGAGTNAAPSVRPDTDTNSGLFWPAADTLGVTLGGTERLRLSGTDLTGTGVDRLRQFAASESVLANVPATVHPGEQLCKQAVLWLDSAHSSASGQTVSNLGWGGSLLDATIGSTTGVDSNDPKFLDWTGESYLYLPGVAGNYASVPDAADLDITGDLTVTVKCALDDWTPSVQQFLAAKYNTTGSQRSWQLGVNTNGTLDFIWSTDGTATVQATSTVPTGATDGDAVTVRVVLDVDDGGVYKVYFYTSTDGGATWSQLGATVTGGSTTSVYASTAVLEVGSRVSGTLGPAAGKFYRAIVSSGVHTASVPVCDIDFSVLQSGSATSLTTRDGRTCTITRSSSGRKAVAVVHQTFLLGTDDYMEVADSDLLDFGATDSFTVVAVLRQWATFSVNGVYVGKTAGFASSDAGWGLKNFGSPATAANFYVGDGTTLLGATGGTLTAGQLALAAGVRNVAADSLTVYYNGTAGTPVTDPTTGSLANSGALRFGRLSGAGTSYVDAEFYALLLFRRVLTSDEITTLTNYYSGRVGA